MIWIETFFSHFGAMRCKKMCDKTGIAVVILIGECNLRSGKKKA